MWESAQDRDLPECGFPKMGPQNRPTLVILIRKSNGFGVRIKLVTSSPPALNDIWLGPSFLVGVNIWKSRTESYWYWEFGQTRSTDFLNRHAPMRKTINRVDAFWWSMLLPKKKMFSMPQNILPQAWMVEQIHSKWSTQKGFTGTDTQTPQMPLCWSRQPIGTPSQTLNSRSAPFRETSRSVAFLGSD